MRALFSSAIAALFGSSAAFGIELSAMKNVSVLPPQRMGPGSKVLRIRTGRSYPHSSTRQRARYARQIAAGQLRMEGVGA